MTENTDLLKILEWRYAVKSFDPNQKIDSAKWKTLEEALRLTPSSYGLQPWRFLVVEDKELRLKLRAVSWNQSQVSDCSHFVVFLCHRAVDEAHIDAYVRSVSETRGIPLDGLEGYRKMMIGDVVRGERSKYAAEWAARQCYIALGNFMTSAALLGVDTCPMEGLDAAKYDEILGLTKGEYRTVMACAAGYRSANDKLATEKKVRFPKEKIIERR
jgi:nitroreductase